MPWGAAIGALGSVAAASMSGGGGGGGESSTTPFFAGIPNLVKNANYANELQGSYMSEPFNSQQQAAANNIFAQSDYMRSLVPGLLSQIQMQPLGYDRANPSARPRAYDWSGLMNSSADTAQQGLGLLANSSNNSMVRAQQEADARAAAAAAAQPAQQGPVSQAFRQAYLPPGMAAVTNTTYKALGGALSPERMQASGNGGYGAFQYGMNVKDIMADPRLEADARMYFALGGEDPFDVYEGAYMAADRRRALEDQRRADQIWNAT